MRPLNGCMLEHVAIQALWPLFSAGLHVPPPTTLPPSASLPLFHWPPHAHCHLPQLSLLLAHAPPPASHASLCPITSAPHHHAILPCRPPFACHRMSFLPFLLAPVPLATRSASFHPTWRHLHGRVLTTYLAKDLDPCDTYTLIMTASGQLKQKWFKYNERIIGNR